MKSYFPKHDKNKHFYLWLMGWSIAEEDINFWRLFVCVYQVNVYRYNGVNETTKTGFSQIIHETVLTIIHDVLHKSWGLLKWDRRFCVSVSEWNWFFPDIPAPLCLGVGNSSEMSLCLDFLMVFAANFSKMHCTGLIPQSTCSWKWHQDSFQLGDLTRMQHS